MNQTQLFEQEIIPHKFPYKWTLKDAIFTKDKGKVFSCFSCGGGSTMGYKLAGFDVIGCNEIDPKMMTCYIENHKPKYSYLESIETFKLRNDLPKELYNLDILDGSPPCSSFSMAGNREKDWGKEKKFREGQQKQVLDELFFHFIDLAEKLQPKIIIAENVKGLMLGSARKYLTRIYKALDKAGYNCQPFLLDASRMGVPQRRERIFFICVRKDIENAKLDFRFNETKIPYKIIYDGMGKPLTDFVKRLWDNRNITDKDLSRSTERLDNKSNNFGTKYLHDNKVCLTLTTKGVSEKISFNQPLYMSNTEAIKAGSFPTDYNFANLIPSYLIGMSVPPVMTAQIATRVYEQILSNL